MQQRAYNGGLGIILIGAPTIADDAVPGRADGLLMPASTVALLPTLDRPALSTMAHLAVLRQALWCRPYQQKDRAWAFETLAFLPNLYPRGGHWLDKRLDEVLASKADCSLVLLNRVRVGLMIETPKGKGTLKLSTLWVDPRFRGIGAGRYLLTQAMARWLRNDLEYVYVTTDVRRAPLVQPFLEQLGFVAGPISFARYGELRDELVLWWRPTDNPTS